MTIKTKRSPEVAFETGDNKRQRTPSKDYEVSRRIDVQNLLDELKHSDPVLQIPLKNNNAIPDISPSSDDLLQDLLFPLSPDDFKSCCFRRKAVHISSNRKDRVYDISTNYMFGLDSKRIFEETSSDRIFLWIPSNDRKEVSSLDSLSNGQKSLQSIDIEDPNTAHILHTHSNYASYCRAPPELEQLLVSKMLRNVGLGLGQYDPTGSKLTTLGRGEVETFIGTKDHLTGWHTDFQENFTIQLSGRKKWSLKQGTVKHPMRGTTPHYKSSADVIENQIKAARLSNPDYQFGKQDLDGNGFGTEVDIILDAGDVLYFPAGMWHKVETLEEGVSINISLMGTTYASFCCRTLEHLLLEKEEWREVICSDKETGYDAVEKLKALIKDLPAVVEKIGSNSIAEGMLPPALRTPPAFEFYSNGDEGGKECEDEHDEGIGTNEALGDQEVAEEVDEEDFSDDGDEDIIDINEFEMPETFKSITLSRENCWKRNPLASLIKMTEIKSFFKKSEEQNYEDNKHLFVLNSNFAGNEMHESAVRVVLRDRSGELDRLCSLRGKELEDAIENLKAPPSALIYFGYIIFSQHTS